MQSKKMFIPIDEAKVWKNTLEMRAKYRSYKKIINDCIA